MIKNPHSSQNICINTFFFYFVLQLHCTDNCLHSLSLLDPTRGVDSAKTWGLLLFVALELHFSFSHLSHFTRLLSPQLMLHITFPPPSAYTIQKMVLLTESHLIMSPECQEIRGQSATVEKFKLI